MRDHPWLKGKSIDKPLWYNKLSIVPGSKQEQKDQAQKPQSQKGGFLMNLLGPKKNAEQPKELDNDKKVSPTAQSNGVTASNPVSQPLEAAKEPAKEGPAKEGPAQPGMLNYERITKLFGS